MEARHLAGRWKAFVALYSSRVPGLTEPLLAATVLVFTDQEVRVEVREVDDYRVISRQAPVIRRWLQDWFGHPMLFVIKSRHLHLVR